MGTNFKDGTFHRFLKIHPAEVASDANNVLFTTGLGTPTGNPCYSGY